MIIDNGNRTLVVVTAGEGIGRIGLAWPKREGHDTIRVDMSDGMRMKPPGDIRPVTLEELRVA